ncbi:MAG: hypothetical protein WCJ35_02380 [Planctomycetota bacterium]
MKLKKNDVAAKRNPLSDDDKKLMLTVLIRNPTAFERAKDMLMYEHFDDIDMGYRAVWTAAKNFFEEYEELPTLEFLQAETLRLVREDPGMLIDDDLVDMIDEFLLSAFSPEWGEAIKTSEPQINWACNAAQMFMEEALARRVQDDVRSVKGRITVNMQEILEQACAEAASIASLADGGGGELFPEGWDIDGGINVTSTGIPFFDSFLAGGHAPGEVYGLLGPYGSCKTVLAVMLAVEAARHAYGSSLTGSEDHGYVFLASYEAGPAELRLRMLSYAAQIHRKSLESMGKDGMKTLSTSKKLRPYEKKMFAAALADGKNVLGEQGRVKQAMKWLEDHIIVLDMAGNDAKHASAGSGHIAEICRKITTELHRRGKNAKASLAIVDYVGAMARRHLEATGKDESNLRHLIGGTPLMAKNKIAAKFNCPVWLLHQLSGAANQKGPAAQVHHTDAAECKSFAENLDFAFVIGKPDNQNLCQINSTKHRRTGHCPEVIVRVRGAMNRVEGTANKYVVDPYSRQIVEKSHMSAVMNPKKYASCKAIDPIKSGEVKP